MAIKLHRSLHVHAGEWLKTEVVEANGVTISRLADHFGVSCQALSTVLNGRAALTADMAIRFEKAFGVKADTLLRMQSAFDLAKAREHEAELVVERMIAA